MEGVGQVGAVGEAPAVVRHQREALPPEEVGMLAQEPVGAHDDGRRRGVRGRVGCGSRTGGGEEEGEGGKTTGTGAHDVEASALRSRRARPEPALAAPRTPA
ncbi:MAG: hypothetical protein AMXMBFR53_03140 [Gemmatimonadota bacterium]